MRIHSNYLTASDIYSAVADLPGVDVEITHHGSQSRARAFEVQLSGNGYARNTGKHGADRYEKGATWDEWGVFLARLFDIDPNAVCGSAKYPTYVDGYSFHLQTHDRFESLSMPEDTHKRHNFKTKSGTGVWTCTKCTAQRSYR